MSQFDDNQSLNSKEKYSLNFSISYKNPNDNYSNDSMSSNVISETTLMEDHILLKKKSLLKRKFLSSKKIYYREIIDLELIKSSSSSLFSSIKIIYSKNGYSKRFLTLSSSDNFAVRWFYDAFVVKYSYFKSALNDRYDFNSNEYEWVLENKSDHSFKQSELSDFCSHFGEELSDEEKRKLKKKMQFERCSNGEY